MTRKGVFVFIVLVLYSSLVVAQDWRVDFSASANPTLDDASVRFSSSGEFTFSIEGDVIMGGGSGSVDAILSSPDCSGSDSTSFDFPVAGSFVDGDVTFDPFSASPSQLEILGTCSFGTYSIQVPLVLMEGGKPIELEDGKIAQVTYNPSLSTRFNILNYYKILLNQSAAIKQAPSLQ